MSAENKAIARRALEELWGGGSLDVVDELFADDFVGHAGSGMEPIRGRDAQKQFVGAFREAFPDESITIEQQVAEGDVVVTRWTAKGTHQGNLMGIPATGRETTTSGITIHRIRDGKIAEGETSFDQLGLLQQIGAVPAMAQQA
jgi:steroid delta-isomerase-like uncharacterized protein